MSERISGTSHNPTPRASSQWYSLTEAADYTGLADRTVRRFVADGDLPAYRVGKRQLRFKRSDLDALFVPIPTTGTAS